MRWEYDTGWSEEFTEPYSEPEEPPRECGYCYKEEPEPDIWGVDEWGTCICDECAEELRRENEELKDCDVEEFPDCR